MAGSIPELGRAQLQQHRRTCSVKLPVWQPTRQEFPPWPEKYLSAPLPVNTHVRSNRLLVFKGAFNINLGATRFEFECLPTVWQRIVPARHLPFSHFFPLPTSLEIQATHSSMLTRQRTFDLLALYASHTLRVLFVVSPTPPLHQAEYHK